MKPLTRFRKMQLEFALKKRAWARLGRRHRDVSLSFRDDQQQLILLTPWRNQANGVNWRVTWFNLEGEPCGHTEALTHRDALDGARAYGARVDSAMPSVPRSGRLPFVTEYEELPTCDDRSADEAIYGDW